jgi:hypothetical protein
MSQILRAIVDPSIEQGTSARSPPYDRCTGRLHCRAGRCDCKVQLAIQFAPPSLVWRMNPPLPTAVPMLTSEGDTLRTLEPSSNTSRGSLTGNKLVDDRDPVI